MELWQAMILLGIIIILLAIGFIWWDHKMWSKNISVSATMLLLIIISLLLRWPDILITK